MPNIVAIAGSPSHPSRTYGILEYSQMLLQREGCYTDIISVRDIPAEDLAFGRYNSPAIELLVELLQKADGVIVCTPIYKSAYTGVLKAFLDLLPQNIFHSKVVLTIATGGTIAHLLGINYALKPVLFALGAQYVLNGVYAVNEQIQWLTNGCMALDGDIDERLKNSLYELVEAVRVSQRVSQGLASIS